MSTLARNRKATHDYVLLDRFEAGIVLHGWEVKSIVAGKVQLADAHVTIRRGEAWLVNCHINAGGNVDPARGDNPRRDRKLLLHGQEIHKLDGKVKQSGLTIVVVSLYSSPKSRKIKAQVALAKGKKRHDKRQAIRDRDIRRGRG